MYTPLPFPYDYWSKQLTPAGARRGLEKLIGEIPILIERFRTHSLAQLGSDLSVTASDEELDELPSRIAKLGGLKRVAESEIEERLSAVPTEQREAFRIMVPTQTLDEETNELVFDGALLWGEAFRLRFPQTEWRICRTPVSNIYYGEPVIVNPSVKFTEFGLVGELHGKVAGELLGRPNTGWPLCKTMKMRAYEFELGPDPR